MEDEKRGEQFDEFPPDFVQSRGRPKRSNKDKVAMGCGVAVLAVLGLGVIGAIVGDPPAQDAAHGSPTPKASTPVSASDSSEAAPDRVPGKAGSATQDNADDVLLVIRQSFMPVIFCSGEINNLRAVADKVNAGRGTASDAYSAAHTAERDCQKMVAEKGDYDERPFKGTALNGIYERTMPACHEVSSKGVAAAKVAKMLLDGDATLKNGQEFRDLNIAIAGKIAECKLGLQGIAETAGVPSDDVEFLEL